MGAADDGLRVEVLPDPVLVQPSEGRRHLHFDLWLRNDGRRAWRLTGLELWALDDEGAVTGRRALDGNGLAPSIETLPARDLPPGGELYLFNPFPDWRADLPMARLRCRLHLVSGEGADEATVEATVAPRAYEQRADLRLPLAGRVLVDDAHELHAHHRRVPLSDPLVRERVGYRRHVQRYAYDLVLVDDRGRARPGASDEAEGYFGLAPPQTRNEDYLVFGAAVLAPAAGRVVVARDDLPDQAPWTPGVDLAECRGDPSPLLGNHVLIDHGHGELSELAHLRQGSVVPRVGQEVARGEPIAQVGNNGSSFYPHLHHHLMTDPDPSRAEGLPACYAGYAVLSGQGWRRVARGSPATGEVLWSGVLAHD